jgi:hypothetical protein
MENEKIMILKMLESGKITSAEAAQLLQSVDEKDTPASAAPPPVPKSSQAPPPVPPRGADYDRSRSNNGPASSSADMGRKLEDMAVDMGRKAVAFAKDMEPKIQKFTESVASTIVGGADRLSRSISETASQPTSHPGKPAAAGPSGGKNEKNLEMLVSAGYNELDISCINGELRLKGYNGDKITAKLSYKPRRSGAAIELKKLGGRYYLNYEQDDFEQVSIDAYVPERSFQVIKLENLNGLMDISSLAANEITLSNSNGNTKLAALGAEKLVTESSNGHFTLSNIAADTAEIENVNGLLEAEELDVAKLSLTNFNGPLSLWVSSFARYNQYDWAVETGNAKMTMNLPASPDLGYDIKARAAMGDIRLGLTGLQYTVNEPAMAEARSAHYDKAAKQIRLSVETSNAPLTIN